MSARSSVHSIDQSVPEVEDSVMAQLLVENERMSSLLVSKDQEIAELKQRLAQFEMQEKRESESWDTLATTMPQKKLAHPTKARAARKSTGLGSAMSTPSMNTTNNSSDSSLNTKTLPSKSEAPVVVDQEDIKKRVASQAGGFQMPVIAGGASTLKKAGTPKPTATPDDLKKEPPAASPAILASNLVDKKPSPVTKLPPPAADIGNIKPALASSREKMSSSRDQLAATASPEKSQSPAKSTPAGIKVAAGNPAADTAPKASVGAVSPNPKSPSSAATSAKSSFSSTNNATKSSAAVGGAPPTTAAKPTAAILSATGSDETAIKSWIESELKESSVLFPSTLQEGLRDGQVLCKLANKLRKDGKNIKINTSKFSVGHLENINSFLKCLNDTFKIALNASFTSADLYENTDMAKVIKTLQTLKQVAQK